MRPLYSSSPTSSSALCSTLTASTVQLKRACMMRDCGCCRLTDGQHSAAQLMLLNHIMPYS